jgi:membrane protein DedA with SNARE-associated domain
LEEAKRVLLMPLYPFTEAGCKALEQFIDTIISLNPIWIYFVAAAISYIENIFPPFPSDVVLVAAGYLCAAGHVDFFIILIISTLGSASGFMTMYKIGSWFGLKVIETKKFKFLKLDEVHKVEAWFQRYGYLVVVVNRFLAGTRAVIAFFTGISNLSFWKTTFLACISSLVWNAILLYTGKSLGANWRVISQYLDTYGKAVLLITIFVILIILGYGYLKNKKQE